ncbi:hypothetical protein Ciccas_011639 [Cichlidogyrus casuarinus]|uniref:G-protein coupled receptors family 1 profile domain-containing protein n=1 Tax=Cichlidogyrus casuarinus TaxID=1844966 RepID=A0ABD2PQQ2_9PLAT
MSNLTYPDDDYYGSEYTLPILGISAILGFFANFLVILIYLLNKTSSKWHKIKREHHNRIVHMRHVEQLEQQSEITITPENVKESTSDPVAGFFVIVLASSDLCSCIILIPMTIVLESANYSSTSKFTCHANDFIKALLPFFSCIVMAIISFDRYMYICHPFTKCLTLRRALITVLCVLFLIAVPYSLTFSTKVTIANSSNVNERYTCGNGDGLITDTLTYMNYAFFAILIMCVCIFYSLIYCTVLKSRKASVKIQLLNPPDTKGRSFTKTGSADQANAKKIKERLRTILMLFMVAFCFSVTYGISIIVMSNKGKSLLASYLYLVMAMVDPIIYLTINKSLRNDITLIGFVLCQTCYFNSKNRKPFARQGLLPYSRRTGPKVLQGSVVQTNRNNSFEVV